MLRQIITDVAPDVVHLHSSKAGLAGRLALRGRIPTVFEPNAWSFLAVSGFMKQAAILWERMAARWTHATICVSDEEKSTAEGLRIRNSMYVVPNGLPLADWPAPNDEETVLARRSLLGEQHTQQSPVVVSVGRLCRQKGQDLLLKAWRYVRIQHPTARLFLIGDGSDRAMLQPLADESVIFVGPSTSVRNWYLAADLIVMPSRWEGLSLALLEAMATQRCVVAFDVAGMKDALRNDAGILVPPESVESFASAICSQLDDVPGRLTLAANARRRVESQFDIRQKHQRVAAIYELIGSKRSPGNPERTLNRTPT